MKAWFTVPGSDGAKFELRDIPVPTAGAGQVLVSGRVAESTPPQGVSFVELGRLRFKGIARPVQVLEARGA